MTPGRPDLEDAARVPVLDVARALRLDIGRDGKSFGPCPSCGETVRASDGKSDKRGRCRVRQRAGFPDWWFCNTNGSEGCGAKGDGPGLVSLKLCDGREGPKGSDVRTVLDWYREHGWLDSGAGWSQGAHVPGAVTPEAPAAPVPDRPPLSEVLDVWGRCVPVTQDKAVSAWLRNRHDGPLDPELIAKLDLARALPKGINLPSWARRNGGQWNVRGYLLIVRAFEADGAGWLRLGSLHARSIIPGVPDSEKATWAMGGATGLVFAWWPGGVNGAPNGNPFMPELPLFEIAEGVPDWLRLACERSGMQRRPVVWGVTSGGAQPELAALVPEGWTVALRTHADKPGEEYATGWSGLLAKRGCSLWRVPTENQKRPGAI